MRYALIGAALLTGVGAGHAQTPGTERTMKINVRVESKLMTATLVDNATAREFVSLLPLTVTMRDLFHREKYGRLPRPISEHAKRTRSYEVGDIVYWSPGPDVAIYYRQDGESIPSPGIIAIGKLDGDAKALDVPGSVKVTFERAQ